MRFACLVEPHAWKLLLKVFLEASVEVFELFTRVPHFGPHLAAFLQLSVCHVFHLKVGFNIAPVDTKLVDLNK